MKKKFLISIIAVAAILTLVNLSVSSATMLEEELHKLTLLKGQTHPLGETSAGDEISVSFSQILAESRCPKGAHCIWAGEVTVELIFEKDGSAHREKLVLPGAGNPKSLQLHGIRITLLEVYPFPELDVPEPAPEDFRIVVNIEKL